MTTDLAPVAEIRTVRVGDVLPELVRTPTTTQLVMYAGAEHDYMPVHFDHHYAVAAGQTGVITHGWLTFAFLLQTVTTWLPPETARVVQARSRYRRPTYPGRPVVCRGVVTAVDPTEHGLRIEVHVDAYDGHGPDAVLTTTADAALLVHPDAHPHPRRHTP
ncbi:MAG: dehydratase [Nocardioides sp.]|nr:dehydratase [Nocardioides sp.]